MIPNYPYFGLPNYMRYINPNVYPPFNQPYQKIKNSSNNIHQTISRPSSHTPSHTTLRTTPVSGKKSNFNNNASKSKENNQRNKNLSQESSPFFSLFGINLYFDDVLLICIIFFLYNEHVDDPYLFFALILLLLN